MLPETREALIGKCRDLLHKKGISYQTNKSVIKQFSVSLLIILISIARTMLL
jgi:hypothetical protein